MCNDINPRTEKKALKGYVISLLLSSCPSYANFILLLFEQCFILLGTISFLCLLSFVFVCLFFILYVACVVQESFHISFAEIDSFVFRLDTTGSVEKKHFCYRQ